MMFAQSLLAGQKIVKEVAEKVRIKNPAWNQVWYFLGLPVILTLSSLAAWGDVEFRLQRITMALLTSALYIIIWLGRQKSHHFLSYRVIGMSVFYTTVGYMLIFSVLAIGRIYYSRSYLLSSYGFMVAWFILGAVFFRKEDPRYIIIRGGLANRIRGFSKLGGKYMEMPKVGKNIRKFDGIVMDLHYHDDKDMLKALADSSLSGVPVLHAANVLESYTGRSNLSYLAREGIYDLEKTKNYRVFKRVWEVGLIVLLSPLVIPLAVVTAIAIKLESSGPVIFRQERIGKDGRLFSLFKFRSMHDKSEEFGIKFAEKEDDRTTRVGRFIRKFRIDELPQFWNIFKGDMSLIGPRPEQKDFVSFFNDEIPFYYYRHKIRPGITGWAQIKGGYAASLEATKKKLEYDLYYVKNISLSFDLLIVYATLRTIITGFGSR